MTAETSNAREPDVAMALHWIDRYAAGIDDECQIDLVADALGVTLPDGYATAPPPAAARGDVRIIARDIHYAIMDAGLAPLSNADNHKVREAILRVLQAALAAEGVQADPKPEARGVVDEAMVERAWVAFCENNGSARQGIRAALTAAFAQQPAAVDRARFRKAPCYLCGYNGPGYFQPETHPCAALYHAARPGGSDNDQVPTGNKITHERNIMNEEQRKSFENVARPLIQWLCENVHPHHTVIVTSTNAELLEGSCSTGQILDYVKD